MRKLLVAAGALALAVSTMPSLMGQAEAASVQSPFCQFAKAQKNLVDWNAYYHCLGTAPGPRRVVLRSRAGREKSPFCQFAKTQKNLVAWNAYYHCLSI